MKYLFVILFIFPIASWSADYWATGSITEYHVQNGRIVVGLNNVGDPKCQGYDYYGDYMITFPNPAENPSGAMMAAHKAQVLFDFYKNEKPVNLYVSESASYCAIHIVSNEK